MQIVTSQNTTQVPEINQIFLERCLDTSFFSALRSREGGETDKGRLHYYNRSPSPPFSQSPPFTVHTITNTTLHHFHYYDSLLLFKLSLSHFTPSTITILHHFTGQSFIASTTTASPHFHCHYLLCSMSTIPQPLTIPPHTLLPLLYKNNLHEIRYFNYYTLKISGPISQ